MNRFFRWSVVLASAVSLIQAAGTGDAAFAPSKLRYESLYILEAVARELNVTLRSDVPMPAIFLQSATPLARFQDALASQWGFRPRVFANAYAVARNEIYLMDDASYYTRLRRTLDDSLAHELAHYIQVRYFSADLADQSCELEAISVQQWFRQEHATPQVATRQLSEANSIE